MKSRTIEEELNPYTCLTQDHCCGRYSSRICYLLFSCYVPSVCFFVSVVGAVTVDWCGEARRLLHGTGLPSTVDPSSMLNPLPSTGRSDAIGKAGRQKRKVYNTRSSASICKRRNKDSV